MEEKENIMDVIGLISLRKTELYNKIIFELSKEKQISDIDKEIIKKQIATIDFENLLSQEEKRNKKINPQLKLENLDLDINSIIKK